MSVAHSVKRPKEKPVIASEARASGYKLGRWNANQTKQNVSPAQSLAVSGSLKLVAIKWARNLRPGSEIVCLEPVLPCITRCAHKWNDDAMAKTVRALAQTTCCQKGDLTFEARRSLLVLSVCQKPGDPVWFSGSQGSRTLFLTVSEAPAKLWPGQWQKQKTCVVPHLMI